MKRLLLGMAFSLGACFFWGDGDCGNGATNPGEECDGESFCSEDCRFLCGNGVVDSGEECDNGAQNSDTAPNGCRSGCKAASCGDHVLDAGEICDDDTCGDPKDPGQCQSTSGDGCRQDCQGFEVCGDGLLDVTEECDDGNGTDGDGCSASCTLEEATCGNGIIEAGEVCYFPAQLLELTAPAQAVAIGDINGDGLFDLAFAQRDFVSTLLQDAQGFTTGASFPLDGDPQTVSLVDVSNDGADDLIATTFLHPDLHIFLNDGAGLLSLSQELESFSLDRILPGDFDGDGDIDIAFDEVNVTLNDGSGQFGDPFGEFLTENFPFFAVQGDLDGDNDPDIVTANQETTVSTRKNNGDATFAEGQSFFMKGLLGAENGSVAPGTHPLAIGDIDQDSDLDLMVATDSNFGFGDKDQIAFLVNNGGTLDEPIFASLPIPPDAIATQVQNGELILWVANSSLVLGPPLASFPLITVYRVQGASLIPLANLSPGFPLFSFEVGDLNQDGAPDLIGTTPFSNVASVLVANP